MCFKMVSGNSKIVFNRLRFTLFPVTPSLKSDWNCLPHEGHFINIPPMSSGNRNCCPQSGHFFSLYSVMVGLDLFNIVRGVFLSASRLPPRVAFIQVSRTGRRPMVGQPACVSNGMRPSLLLRKHSDRKPDHFPALLVMASVYGMPGQSEEGCAVAAKIMKTNPGYCVEKGWLP